jgi:crossover junction endodeoxyribonuclease RuvC
MKICGIDPGQTGALAIVDLTNAVPELIALLDVPTVGSGAQQRADVIQVWDWLLAHKPDRAVIERAMALPRQGASSGFKFGRTTGALEAVIVLSRMPWSLVEPAAWKKYHKLGRDKEQARARAMQLVPSAHDLLARKRDHGRAEALLICLYGAHVCHL